MDPVENFLICCAKKCSRFWTVYAKIRGDYLVCKDTFILRIPISLNTNCNGNHSSGVHSFSNSCGKMGTEKYCLVPYVEILTESEMKLDKINTIRGCVRLRRHLTAAVHRKLSGPPDFCFVPVKTVRRTVHTDRRSIAVSLLKKTDPKAARQYEVNEGTDGLENELYYVNRFFVDRSENYLVRDTKLVHTREAAAKSCDS